MEDGSIVNKVTSSELHPAHFDQQVAQLRDLLPQARAFIVCLLLNDEEDADKGYSHVAIGKQPGISSRKFIELSLQDIVEAVNQFLTEGGEDGGGDATED